MLDPRLLQLCDSAFPSGAFSQSFGLETAIVEGRVTDGATFAGWLAAYLRGSVATLDARALVLAMRDPGAIALLDEVLSASVFAPEVRAASRRLARATLDAFAAMGIDGAVPVVHHSLACAIGYRAIGAEPADAVVAHLSATAAALAAVAARAVPLGQRELGRVLWELRPTIATLAAEAAAVTGVDDLTQSAFDCEIDALRHGRLDGRMFAS
jgi:urease accessory protein